MADITFVVHSEWLDDLEDLDIERQDQIIADIIRAGCEREMAHSTDKELVSKVKTYLRAITYSKKKYEDSKEQGNRGGRTKKIDDAKIEELAKAGYSSKQIAEMLNCSKSAVDHSDGWRNRKA
jgi:DNA-binding NarL/FixJ family response regulator